MNWFAPYSPHTQKVVKFVFPVINGTRWPDTPQQLGCQMSQLWIELKRRSAQEIEIWQRFVKPQKPPHAAVQNFPIKLPIPLSRGKDVIVIWLTCENFFNSLSPQKKYSLFKICIIINFSKLYNVLSYLYN